MSAWNTILRILWNVAVCYGAVRCYFNDTVFNVCSSISSVTLLCARGSHAVFSNHQMGWLVSVSAVVWSLHSEREKSSLWISLREDNTWGRWPGVFKMATGKPFPTMLQFPWLRGVDLSFVSQSVWDTLRSPWAGGDMTNTKDRPCLLLSTERRTCGSLILYELSCLLVSLEGCQIH